MSNTFELVTKLLAHRLKVEPETLTLETTLADLNVDSLDTIELLFDVEDILGFRFSDYQQQQEATSQDMPTTLQDVVTQIDEYLAKYPCPVDLQSLDSAGIDKLIQEYNAKRPKPPEPELE